MKRDLPDFFLIEPRQLEIHKRLENWARYVQVRGSHWQAPIWKLGRSNGRQWHEPLIKDHIDTLDGHAVEKAVGQLPQPHRDALRWSYVTRNGPSRIKRVLGVNDDGLMRLIKDGRAMLINRRA